MHGIKTLEVVSAPNPSTHEVEADLQDSPFLHCVCVGREVCARAKYLTSFEVNGFASNLMARLLDNGGQINSQ